MPEPIELQTVCDYYSCYLGVDLRVEVLDSTARIMFFVRVPTRVESTIGIS